MHLLQVYFNIGKEEGEELASEIKRTNEFQLLSVRTKFKTMLKTRQLIFFQRNITYSFDATVQATKRSLRSS